MDKYKHIIVFAVDRDDLGPGTLAKGPSDLTSSKTYTCMHCIWPTATPGVKKQTVNDLTVCKASLIFMAPCLRGFTSILHHSWNRFAHSIQQEWGSRGRATASKSNYFHSHSELVTWPETLQSALAAVFVPPRTTFSHCHVPPPSVSALLWVVHLPRGGPCLHGNNKKELVSLFNVLCCKVI